MANLNPQGSLLQNDPCSTDGPSWIVGYGLQKMLTG